MGVKLHPKTNSTCYRIYRAWGGKEYQRYVPLNGNPKRARKEADEIDAKFKQSQDAYKLRMTLAKNSLFHESGQVIGLSRVICHREGRASNEQFKLRIKIPAKDSLHFTTISISHHGFDVAYDLATEKICEWRGIGRHAEERQRLQAAKSFYMDDVPA
jgi:hypothetical protein